MASENSTTQCTGIDTAGLAFGEELGTELWRICV